MPIPIVIRKNKSHFKYIFLVVRLYIQLLLACFSFICELIWELLLQDIQSRHKSIERKAKKIMYQCFFS